MSAAEANGNGYAEDRKLIEERHRVQLAWNEKLSEEVSALREDVAEMKTMLRTWLNAIKLLLAGATAVGALIGWVANLLRAAVTLHGKSGG